MARFRASETVIGAAATSAVWNISNSNCNYNFTCKVLKLCWRAVSKVQQTKTQVNIQIQGRSKGDSPRKTMEYIGGDYGGNALLYRNVLGLLLNVATEGTAQIQKLEHSQG